VIAIIATNFSSIVLHTGTMPHPQHAGTPEPAKAARSAADLRLAAALTLPPQD